MGCKAPSALITTSPPSPRSADQLTNNEQKLGVQILAFEYQVVLLTLLRAWPGRDVVRLGVDLESVKGLLTALT